MDLDTMLAEAAPARHVSLDGPDSPAAVGLYRRITVAPPSAPQSRRRTRFPALALLTTAAAVLAAGTTLVLISGALGGSPHAHRSVRAQLAAWSVAKQPDGLVMVTIRELRDPLGLWRMLRADGVPANVRFLPHNFMPTTSASAIPRACRAPHLSARANALLQSKITPWPDMALSPGRSGRDHAHGRPSVSTGGVGFGRPGVILSIRPSAIPHGIGLFLEAWAASPGITSGPYLSMQTDLVQVSPRCTGS
jgi:hypothetical protein